MHKTRYLSGSACPDFRARKRRRNKLPAPVLSQFCPVWKGIKPQSAENPKSALRCDNFFTLISERESFCNVRRYYSCPHDKRSLPAGCSACIFVMLFSISQLAGNNNHPYTSLSFFSFSNIIPGRLFVKEIYIYIFCTLLIP